MYRRSQRSASHIAWIIGGIFIAGALIIAAFLNRVHLKEAYLTATAPTLPAEEAYQPPATATASAAKPTPTKPTKPAPKPTAPTSTNSGDAAIPTEKRLAVPFTSQAPTANWDAVHEETCEEASVVMAAAYYEGKTGRIDAKTAEALLQEAITYEMEEFGFFEDTDAAQTKKLLEGLHPNLVVDIVPVTSAEDIKKYIAKGMPVMIPADGKALKNPNFRNGGPPFHMFVVRGYTADHFIVNDPGTRLGENYLYTYETILNAVHDWNGGDVKKGAKVMLVVRTK